MAGPARNFQVFDRLDFLAEVTRRIPDPGEPLIRYYRCHSIKAPGQRAQQQPTMTAGAGAPARQGRAALIKQACEARPMCCPKCGYTVEILAFIQRRQTEVIEKLRCAKRTSDREGGNPGAPLTKWLDSLVSRL